MPDSKTIGVVDSAKGENSCINVRWPFRVAVLIKGDMHVVCVSNQYFRDFISTFAGFDYTNVPTSKIGRELSHEPPTSCEL